MVGRSHIWKQPEGSQERQPLGDGWACLWPFFTGEQIAWEEGTHRQLHAPWPFFVYAEDTRPRQPSWEMRLWPFWGRKTATATKRNDADSVQGGAATARLPLVHSTDTFVLWPLCRRVTLEEEKGQTATSTRVALAWQTYVEREAERTTLRDNRLWPLFSLHEDSQGTAGPDGYDLRLLDLWPFAHPPPVIRRNFQPLWTLYQQSGGPEGEFHQQLLWGLWEWRQVPARERRKIAFPLLFDYERDRQKLSYSLLCGLWRQERSPGMSTQRLLWFFRWNTTADMAP